MADSTVYVGLSIFPSILQPFTFQREREKEKEKKKGGKKRLDKGRVTKKKRARRERKRGDIQCEGERGDRESKER